MQIFLQPNRRVFFYFLLPVMLVAIATSAHGHPHTFVVTSYTIVFDKQGLKGVRVYWEFDEMYSTTTATEFDLNEDGVLSESESKELISLGKESLPSLNFFTNIQIDGVAYAVTSVDDFRISYEKGILTYDFFVTCPVKASKNGNKIKISPYDNELYLAMLFRQDQPVDFENSELYNVETSIAEDEETLIYFDSIHPYALNLEFSKK